MQHSNEMWTSTLSSVLKFEVQPPSSTSSHFENFRKKLAKMFMTLGFFFFSILAQLECGSLSGSAENSLTRPSCAVLHGPQPCGDRSTHCPMATRQAPGPAGMSAHLWARSSPMPRIIPWIQTAQALGGWGRGCKGCGLLCEVSSSSSVTRLRSLLTKLRLEILEAATEDGCQVATPEFHPFLVADILPSETLSKYFPSAVPAHLSYTIFFPPHNLRFAFTNFSQSTLISYFLNFFFVSPNIDLYSANIFFFSDCMQPSHIYRDC